jgi:hypothetical protein
MTIPNYQLTPRNIPEGWRSYLHRSESLKARICLFDSEKWMARRKWYAKSVRWNANDTEPSRVLSFRTSRVYANDYCLLLLIQNSVKGKLPSESTWSITTPTMSVNYETFLSLNCELGLKVVCYHYRFQNHRSINSRHTQKQHYGNNCGIDIPWAWMRFLVGLSSSEAPRETLLLSDIPGSHVALK